MKRSPGVTLTELMVAVAIISIAVLGMIGAFQAIAVGVQHSKMRTLAANLAQEKMQILRQSSYYRLLVTSNTAYDTTFAPAIPYDTSYYPPETIMEGGTYFERLTHVQMAAESGGTLTALGAASDSGMKMVTVSVTWRQGSAKKKLQLQSIKSNPKATMMTSTIAGTVRDASTNAPIENATITIAENMGWKGITDSSGEYSVKVYSGNYSLIVSAAGYFNEFATCSVAENQELSGTDFDLSAMSSGTVTGTAWINDHIVISQVVGSKLSPTMFDQEYVELYNPTTYFFQLFSGNDVELAPLFYRNHDMGLSGKIELHAVVSNAGIQPKSYFLIANTPTLDVFGTTINADAYYDPATPDMNIIKTPVAGGIGISAGGISGTGAPWIDCVGWDQTDNGDAFKKHAPLCESEGISQAIGFTENEQYIRRTSVLGTITSGWGRCYDSGNNNRDFLAYSSMIWPPNNAATPVEPAVAGTPAIGAIISCNDGLSLPRTAEAAGNPPYARVLLPSVATGTWTMVITSATYTTTISTVVLVAHGDIVGVPNNITVSSWPVIGQHASMLTDISENGYISGTVTDIAGMPINPAITVRAGGVTGSAHTGTGRYILQVASGTYSVVANPGNTNGEYISMVRDAITVNTGQITTVPDILLSKGGMFSAWITRDGINPLPGVAVVALDENGSARSQDVSKSDGSILLVNLATGTYTLGPVLDSGEKSNPATVTRTIGAGITVFASSFTISSAYGSINGKVTAGGKPISTGVLIIASQSSIVSPPTINTSLAAASSLYTTNSYENGTFALDVRGSTVAAYNVKAFYPVPSGDGFAVLASTSISVSVNQGQKVNNIDFAW